MTTLQAQHTMTTLQAQHTMTTYNYNIHLKYLYTFSHFQLLIFVFIDIITKTTKLFYF